MQLLTEFISENSLEKFLLLESGRETDVLKKWKDEEKRILKKEYELSRCYCLKTLCHITKTRILNNYFVYHVQQ